MTASSAIAIAVRQASDALGRGDMMRAAHMAKTIIAAKPETADAWRILGNAANSFKDFTLADQAFGESARLRTTGSVEQARDLLWRAKPLIALGRPGDVVTCVREAVGMGLRTPRDLFQAAFTLGHMGLPAEALPLAEQAVALDPDFPEAWFIIGNSRKYLGRIDAAEAAFNEVIARSRDHAPAAYQALAHVRKWTRPASHVRALEAFQCRSSMEASRIGYALFKEYDDIGDTKAAWDCLQHAARVGRVMETWNDGDEKRRFAAWKTAFPDRGSNAGDMRPRSGPGQIFIVGLPRSGTTLVERILTSHSQVQTIGETLMFAIATRRTASATSPGTISPEIIAAAATADPSAIAADYTTHTAYHHDGSDYTIDKRPDNYEYVGLIRQAFPDAIIIVLDRSPMDALFGAYKQAFAPGAHGWSYTFEDLAAHYHNFRGLIGHWKAVLGDALIEVSLEALIADPEAQIRLLLDGCGLPFQDDCLRPHESEGPVTTASALQVRQPINAQGIGAWKRYREQLQPLRDRLLSLGYDV